MNKKIKFAIIGTGMIAERHAAALAEIPEAELYAVYDRNSVLAESFTEKQGAKVYRTFDELLNDPQLVAVTIATPTGVHKEIAVPCAEAGKHILCEKPLDVTLAKADAIIDACDKNGVYLSAVFQSRFSDRVQLIKTAIETGRFGRLVMCSAQVKWFRSQEYYDSAGWRGTWALDGGGALMNQSIHIIDLLLYLVGEPAMVHAFTGTMTHERLEVEDNACASIKFKNGALGVIEASTSCAPGFPRRLELSGEYGSVTLEDDTITRWQFVDEQPEDEAIRNGSVATTQLKSGASDPRAGSHEGHRRQLLDLITAIKHKQQPSIPGSEGRRAVELICAIYESAKTGRVCRFET
ncbi:MAG: Gfo/Idh/MocA family oxidoreductase [Victivallaceae bacterium]|nr:Gfo/Idh/MocA family oxidoreductase [Victivallaceae bacterium]